MTRHKTRQNILDELIEIQQKAVIIKNSIMEIDDSNKNYYSLYEMLYSINRRLAKYRLAL